ncbi:endonuclease III-like protein 1 [Oppia nitens]|uniref:endonuclease III-like protein 1 n=1 Tax=Oppia nitens TaxID=1686743 RepID=UPI0023DBE76C|nr:endonuclease III-like protein 1 [Oppia nitens]
MISTTVRLRHTGFASIRSVLLSLFQPKMSTTITTVRTTRSQTRLKSSSSILPSMTTIKKKKNNNNKMTTKSQDNQMVIIETSVYFGDTDSDKANNNSSTTTVQKPNVQNKRQRKSVVESTEEPKNWRQLLENIRQMRSDRNAVVDSMGAEKTYDENEGNDKDKRFQILISLMLSSQTRDEITYATMQSLRNYGLTVDHIIATDDTLLMEMIRSVSFYRNKCKFIKRTAIILRDQFDGDIPDTLDGLLSLPGVGPKMAHLAMKIAWNQLTGVAVDTHVHRICNRLKWTNNTKTPEQTQKQLEKWLPKEDWDDFNLLVVGFGQTICSAIKPKCNECLNQSLCPFVSSSTTTTTKIKKKKSAKDIEF